MYTYLTGDEACIAVSWQSKDQQTSFFLTIAQNKEMKM